ncbi:hypothetical protein BYI23_D015600 (plasmid) [Burkholderia sp. YI23]|nr:hypothetical protein BYI23_D015600 [Burkholderia sp. YI23]
MAVLHIAFMALCAYILVIVFGTTDLDLLIGKGVKLPVVDVEVPIVGFYASAPLLVVLVHFNLLLQLQLLSRKLYVFDAEVSGLRAEPIRSVLLSRPSNPASDDRIIAGERDLLHIFPYTYYLVGLTGPLVRRCLGAVVGITVLLLPLMTLLLLQLRFLAYQEPAITWAQRVGVWADVAMVIALWPIIMDRNDNWLDYLHELRNKVRQQRRMAVLWVMLWIAVLVMLFTGRGVIFLAAIAFATAVSVFAVFAAVASLVRRWLSRRMPSGRARRRGALVRVQGMPAFLLVIAVGVTMPLALVAKGESLETSLIGETFISRESPFRFLALNGEVLLAKPASPEIVAQLREDKVKEALTKVERIKLERRGLRSAQLNLTILSRADLMEAHLEGTNLRGAHMEGADLTRAHLEGAHLDSAHLEGANLDSAHLEGAVLSSAHLEGASLNSAHLEGAHLEYSAHLEGADLEFAHLEGADLDSAHLEGADLNSANLEGAYLNSAHLEGANLDSAHLEGAHLHSSAHLEGAYLGQAHLEGADFERAHLEGVNLEFAHLEGADFEYAHLEGADLRAAKLYAASLANSVTSLVDVRGAEWRPLAPQDLQTTTATIRDENIRRIILERLKKTPALPLPKFESCLIDAKTALIFSCQKLWLPEELSSFQKDLYAMLEKLACRATPIARSLIFTKHRWDPRPDPNARLGFGQHMAALLDNLRCMPLQSLTDYEKNNIRNSSNVRADRSSEPTRQTD